MKFYCKFNPGRQFSIDQEGLICKESKCLWYNVKSKSFTSYEAKLEEFEYFFELDLLNTI